MLNRSGSADWQLGFVCFICCFSKRFINKLTAHKEQTKEQIYGASARRRRRRSTAEAGSELYKKNTKHSKARIEGNVFQMSLASDLKSIKLD